MAIFALAGAGSAYAEVTGAADNLRTGRFPHEPSLSPTQLKKGAQLQPPALLMMNGVVYAGFGSHFDIPA